MGFPLASPAERMSSHRENGTVAGGKRRGRPVSALKRRASYILRHGLHQLQCAVGSGFRQFACVLLCVALQTAQAGVHQAVGILRLTGRPPLFSPGLPFNPRFRGEGVAEGDGGAWGGWGGVASAAGAGFCAGCGACRRSDSSVMRQRGVWLDTRTSFSRQNAGNSSGVIL